MNRRQKTENNEQKNSFLLFIVFCSLFIVSCFLFLFRLGATTLTNWDEAWFASVAQDMAMRNDWLAGQFNGQVWFYEPPLLLWALAFLYKFFGASELFLRLPSAVCGMLTVFVVYKLSFLATKSKTAAIFSSLILLSDIEFLFRSRQINVEIVLTLLLFFCLYFAIYAATMKQFNNVTISLSFFFFALCFLTKRAVPFLAIPALLVSAVQPIRRTRLMRPILIGTAIFSIIVLPWFIYQYLHWKNVFIDEFFIGYTVNKIRTANQALGTSIFFYVTALRRALKIWFLFIPFALIWAGFRSKSDVIIRILMVYITTFLFFLTLAPNKASWFLLPIHPAIAVIIGIFLHRIYKECTRGKVFIPVAVCAVCIFQIMKYSSSFIVPDTTRHQATIATTAKNVTNLGDKIYLDDDYLPVAVFYSQRSVVPLRFDRIQTNVPIPDISTGSYILTNTQTFPTLQENVQDNLMEVSRISDVMLVLKYTL